MSSVLCALAANRRSMLTVFCKKDERRGTFAHLECMTWGLVSRATFVLGLLAMTTGCDQLLLPGRSPRGVAKNRQQCVECGLRDGEQQADPDAASKFAGWCEAGDPASCSALGVMYETGRGIGQDLAAAERLYQRACQTGNGGACVNLGRLLVRQDGPRKDVDGAKMMFELACIQGELDGCFALGQQQYSEGKPAIAAATLAKSCTAKHAASCETLGHLYATGVGVTRDMYRANHLFRNACGGGRPAACEWLARQSPAQTGGNVGARATSASMNSPR